MTWLDHLSAAERKQLERAREKRDRSAEEYNAVYRKLKARADSRVRTAAGKNRKVKKER